MLESRQGFLAKFWSFVGGRACIFISSRSKARFNKPSILLLPPGSGEDHLSNDEVCSQIIGKLCATNEYQLLYIKTYICNDFSWRLNNVSHAAWRCWRRPNFGRTERKLGFLNTSNRASLSAKLLYVYGVYWPFKNSEERSRLRRAAKTSPNKRYIFKLFDHLTPPLFSLNTNRAALSTQWL